MDSPLRWFRRHAKILMVVLGSFAMAIFGLGNVFNQLADPGVGPNESAKQTLASWNGGDISRQDVANFQQQHSMTLRFLRELEAKAIEIKKDEFRSLAQPIMPLSEQANQVDLDEQIINRIMLAHKAEKEGIVVSDGVIDDYLGMASGYVGFSRNDLNQINQAANHGNCSLENIRRHLKIELLAQQMDIYTNIGMTVIPNPLEAASLYKQSTELVECEVLPISVEEFFSKLSETPPALELKKLFDEGKLDYADPTGKKPGFKQPNKVAVAYLSAEADTFIQNEINKLTDEQVQKEYDRLVAAKDDMVMEVIPDESNNMKVDNEPPTLPGEKSEAPENEAPENKTPENEAPATEAPKKQPAPADSNPVDASDKKSDELKLDDSKPEKPKTEEPKLNSEIKSKANKPASELELNLDVPDKEREQSSNRALKTIDKFAGPQFVSVGSRQEETDDQKPVAKESEKDKATASETEKKTEPVEKVQTEDQTPVANNKEDDKKSDVKPAAEKKSDDEIGSLFAEDKKIEKRVLPLSEVAEKIKRALVIDDALKQMELKLDQAESMLMTYHTLRMQWDMADNKKNLTEPEKPNIQKLADDFNLVANEIELSTSNEMAETPFGRSFMLIQAPNGQTFPYQLSTIIFDRFDDWTLYDPQRASVPMNGANYLYWVTEKVDARVVEFDEAKSDVEKFWKSRRAIELATEEAEKIAKRVNSEKKTLTELYRDRVSPTGEFSWFSTFGQASFGQPAGVDQAGEQFMKSVFSLEKLQAGVAVNEPKTTVYVVQMLSDRASTEKLGTEYITQKFLPTKRIPPDVGAVSNFYRREAQLDWNQEYSEEMGLKFYGR